MLQAQGQLDKQSDHVKAWRQRFFRLDAPSHRLEYWDFEAEASGPAKSSIDLIDGFVDEVNDTSGSRTALDYPHQFVVRGANADDSFTVCADTDRRRSEWIENLYLATLPSKSGMVFKCSDHLGQWRPRFIRVEFGKLLYWESEEDSARLPLPKGYLELQGGRVVQLPAADQERRYVFAVHEAAGAGGAEGRHYMLCATSQNEYEAWRKVCEVATQRRSERDIGQRFGEAASRLKEHQRDRYLSTIPFIPPDIVGEDGRLPKARACVRLSPVADGERCGLCWQCAG